MARRGEVEEEAKEAVREIAKLIGMAIAQSVKFGAIAATSSSPTRGAMDRAWEAVADAVIEFAEDE